MPAVISYEKLIDLLYGKSGLLVTYSNGDIIANPKNSGNGISGQWMRHTEAVFKRGAGKTKNQKINMRDFLYEHLGGIGADIYFRTVPRKDGAGSEYVKAIYDICAGGKKAETEVFRERFIRRNFEKEVLTRIFTANYIIFSRYLSCEPETVLAKIEEKAGRTRKKHGAEEKISQFLDALQDLIRSMKERKWNDSMAELALVFSWLMIYAGMQVRFSNTELNYMRPDAAFTVACLYAPCCGRSAERIVEDKLTYKNTHDVFSVYVIMPDDLDPYDKALADSVFDRLNLGINSSAPQRPEILPFYASDAGDAFYMKKNDRTLAEDCDMLICFVYTQIDLHPGKEEGTTEKLIGSFLSAEKPVWVVRCTRPVTNLHALHSTQYKKVKALSARFGKFKAECRNEYMAYGEYESDLFTCLKSPLPGHPNHRKFRDTEDADNLARIEDPKALTAEIPKYNPRVIYSLFFRIFHGVRSETVWGAIINRLKVSPYYLLRVLRYTVQVGAYNHPAFTPAVKTLASVSPSDYAAFMRELYEARPDMYNHIDRMKLLPDNDPDNLRLHSQIARKEELRMQRYR